MPLRFEKLPSGAAVIVKQCEVCGGPAFFGENGDLRGAIEARDQGKAGRRDGQPACVKPDALDLALGATQ